MKYFFSIFFLISFFASAQTKHTSKPKKSANAPTTTMASDGYIISGHIKGFPDGTAVSFLNEQTGVPEQQALIKEGKFEIKGKMEHPALIGMVIGTLPTAVSIFLDNSKVKITGDKSALDNLSIIGSPSHTLFTNYVNAIHPYEKIFQPDAEYDSIAIQKVSRISEEFVQKNPNSYVSPIAIIRFYQASEDGVKAEKLYNLMPDAVKNTPYASYANTQIQESKINPLGSLVADFSQPDTTGTPIKISSYRGKYVLLDFWASWCRPCRQENPNVVAAYNRFKSKNFTILCISLDQAKAAWVDAIRMDNLRWSHISDLKGWGNSVAGMFHITSIPQNLLLDPDGKIIAKNLRGSRLDRKLEALLK